jgi:hypothetical protein
MGNRNSGAAPPPVRRVTCLSSSFLWSDVKLPRELMAIVFEYAGLRRLMHWSTAGAGAGAFVTEGKRHETARVMQNDLWQWVLAPWPVEDLPERFAVRVDAHTSDRYWKFGFPKLSPDDCARSRAEFCGVEADAPAIHMAAAVQRLMPGQNECPPYEDEELMLAEAAGRRPRSHRPIIAISVKSADAVECCLHYDERAASFELHMWLRTADGVPHPVIVVAPAQPLWFGVAMHGLDSAATFVEPDID